MSKSAYGLLFRLPIWVSAICIAILVGFPNQTLSEEAQIELDAEQVIKEVLENSTEIKSAEKNMALVEGRGQQESLWENPGIESEATFPEDPSSDIEGSFSLRQEIPLFGQKGSRRKLALIESSEADLAYRLVRQSLVLKTVRGLVKLRQFSEREDVARQRLRLADKAEKKFKKRPFLTENQKSERATFKWSREVIHMTLPQWKSEEREVLLEIRLEGGIGMSTQMKPMPFKQDWPSFPEFQSDNLVTTGIALSEASAKAGLTIAKADSFPSIALGPNADISRGADQVTSWGFVLELAFPLWNRNQGERKAQYANVSKNKLEADYRRKQLEQNWGDLKAAYKESIRELKHNRALIKQGKQSLAEIQEAYLSGRLTASAALEAYEQYQEAVETMHSLELSAYRSLWTAYGILGIADSQKP